MQAYDVIINGGGMVGACMARALSGQGLRIAVIEAARAGQRVPGGYDERAIALAWGTRRILDGLGLWDSLSGMATPIHRILVSERGHFGKVSMDRESEGLPAIGYVVPAQVLGQVLSSACEQTGDVDSYCPARLTGMSVHTDSIEVVVRQGDADTMLSAKLLVAADGADSDLRGQAGIGSEERDYQQSAIVTNVTPQLAHENRAWERFTETGPLALLPMTDQRCGVVWTVAGQQVDAVMALDDDAFIAALQERLGSPLGRLLKVGKRQAWPLRLVSAQRTTAARLALIGNAVHTLHPVAGQGFNLGVRDVAALAELVVDAVRAGEDVGSRLLLEHYAGWRARDHRNVTLFTDGLARLFVIPGAVPAALRSAGMVALDLLPPARRLLTRLTMGRSGRTPRLVRGMPL